MTVLFRELSTGRGAANTAAAAAAGDSKIFDCKFSGGDVRNTCTSLEIAVCPLTEATNDHTTVFMFRTRVSEMPVSPSHSDQEL
jgi:hypothetical protein